MKEESPCSLTPNARMVGDTGTDDMALKNEILGKEMGFKWFLMTLALGVERKGRRNFIFYVMPTVK